MGWGGCLGLQAMTADTNVQLIRITGLTRTDKAHRVRVDLNKVNLTCVSLEGGRTPGKPAQAQGENPREGPSGGLCAGLACSNAVNMLCRNALSPLPLLGRGQQVFLTV